MYVYYTNTCLNDDFGECECICVCVCVLTLVLLSPGPDG